MNIGQSTTVLLPINICNSQQASSSSTHIKLLTSTIALDCYTQQLWIVLNYLIIQLYLFDIVRSNHVD